jgi:hypothetical protein
LHRRELIVLHTVLVVAVLLLAWRLETEWKRANLRYQAIAAAKAGSAVGPAPAVPGVSVPPVNDILAKNIFSSDRNNELQAAKSQKAPPVPVVFGTMNLGGHYEALMAESATKTAFRRMKAGEKLGDYLVAEIADEKVVVDYEGQKTTLNVYESANSVPRTQAAVQSPTPAAAPVVETVAAPPPPVASQAQPAAAAQSGADPGIRVTIEGNRRRMERQSPFGPQVWYEDIPK